MSVFVKARRSPLIAVIALVAVVVLAARSPGVGRGAKLKWGPYSLVFYPDSEYGTFVWLLDSSPTATDSASVGTYFDPESTSTWIARAREFITRPLPDNDTTTVAASPALKGASTVLRVFFARRKSNNHWTDERYLAFRNGETRPLVLNINAAMAKAFLDTLAAVASRTSVHELKREEPEHDSTSCSPWPKPDNRAPRYPISERDDGVQGGAYVSFTITDQGRIDMSTVRILYADTRGFSRAVLDALPALQFWPATKQGHAISKRVNMPFEFTLTDGRDYSPKRQPPTRDPKCV